MIYLKISKMNKIFQIAFFKALKLRDTTNNMLITSAITREYIPM